MNRTRSERRRNKELRKAAARRMVKNAWGTRLPRTQEDIDALCHQMACNCDNLKICRGPCCKSPRRDGWTKGGGKTFEEVLAERIAAGRCE